MVALPWIIHPRPGRDEVRGLNEPFLRWEPYEYFGFPVARTCRLVKLIAGGMTKVKEMQLISQLQAPGFSRGVLDCYAVFPSCINSFSAAYMR